MHTFGFKTVAVAALAVAAITAGAALCAQESQSAPEPGTAPAYTSDGGLLLPADYRTWVFLSSGMDMAYVEGPGMAGMSMFDNVFVNRPAWEAFQRTGTWPDKTVLVLEVRRGDTGSINKRGRFQTAVLGREVHLKDAARFKGGWAFFGFDGDGPGRLIPESAPCYSCHRDHAAVDTTFAQFYPTLLPIAQSKHTLSAAYLADEAAAKPAPAAGH